MAQWEYCKIDLNFLAPRTEDIDLLNASGNDGWELVGITSNNVAYLKRQIREPATEAPAKAPRRKTASSSAQQT